MWQRAITGNSFEQAMTADKGHTNGFDYLRVGLAFAVLFIHVTNIANHDLWVFLWTSWVAPFEQAILPAFFILSGFLVTGSLLRNSIPQFLALRALRLLPALAVEITLSALALGLFATVLPIRDYLASPEFHTYFLNIIGWIHYTLPGVYEGRPINVQLWTIPFELECYVCLVVLALVGLVARKRLLAGLVIAAAFGMTVYAVYTSCYQANWNVPGRALVLSFLVGVLAYLFKSKIPHNRVLFWVACAVTYLLLLYPNLVFLAALPLGYVTIYIGLLRLRTIPFGDFSYGVYLFHYPLALSIFEVAGRTMPWLLLLLLTALSSVAFAALSWGLVEKPALDRKKHVVSFVASVTAGMSDRFSFMRVKSK